jgi:predicted aspartyl protease
LVEVEVSNLEKTKSKKLNALAYIGATLTVLPEEIAREIGIEAKEEDIVETGAVL